MPVDRETILFKGNKADGISIIIDEHAPFAEVLSQLHDKLEAARRFFAGAEVRIRVGARRLENGERDALRRTVGEFGLLLAEEDVATGRRPVAPGSPPAGPARSTHTLLIKRTLRSGQRVDHDGNVVILGDVNPGAVITCTGDIVILGALRGVAHAGCEGDATSNVVALRLEPTQLRIAGFISRAPDGDHAHPGGPERALVRDGVIQVEAYVP